MASKEGRFGARGILGRGTPLSSALCASAESLHHMITKRQGKGLIKGLGSRDETNKVINLHYADDILIFGRLSLPQAMILKWVLLCYEKWSGLKSTTTKDL